jgi:hypothetical protein
MLYITTYAGLYTIIPLYHYTIIPLYHYTIIPLYHYTIIPLYHYTIIGKRGSADGVIHPN